MRPWRHRMVACQAGQPLVRWTRMPTIPLPKRLAIACACVALTGLQQACAGGLGDHASREASACRVPLSERAEAAVLADRILIRTDSRLVFEPSSRDELAREIADVLGAVRTAHLDVAGIRARELVRPDTLILGLDPPLVQPVRAMFDDSGRVVALRTGAPELDSLNDAAGLRGARLLDASTVLFCFAPVLNVRAAAAAYTALDGISYAELDALAGDGPDIEAARVDGTWYLVFRAASGDCPSGCIDEQLFLFTASEGAVMPGDPEAEPFRRLLAERGWGP